MPTHLPRYAFNRARNALRRAAHELRFDRNVFYHTHNALSSNINGCGEYIHAFCCVSYAVVGRKDAFGEARYN